MKQRIKTIIESLQEGLVEREAEIRLSVLGALSGENIFLYGPPGVAKSLISRRIAEIFKNSSYFEYLMQKFSTPEEVFGPISINELKNDNFVRKTEGYLPTAEVAFLDEIFKASPAILNTLLTIINEKIYKNGQEIKKVPLKVLISASNEIPKDLEALYDRFLIRMIVNPIQNKDNLKSMLTSTLKPVSIINKIKDKEWQEWQNKIEKVKLTDDVFELIFAIKLVLNKKDIYISDRRLQKSARLLKASAFFNDRDETNRVDVNLLKYCLWEKEEDFEVVKEIIETTIKNFGIDSGIDILEVKKEKSNLEKEIYESIYEEGYLYEDIFLINNKPYFKVKTKFDYSNYYGNHQIYNTIYIPVNKIDSKDKWIEVLHSQKRETKSVRAKWKKDKFILYLNKRQNNWRWDNGNYDDENYFSQCQYKPVLKNDVCKKLDNLKGFFKQKIIHERVKEVLIEDIDEIKDKLFNALEIVKKEKEKLIKNLSNIFLEDYEVELSLSGINSQIEDLEFELKDLERIYNKVKNDD